MDSYLNENLLEVLKVNHSPDEVLQKWRKFCGVVKNPKRRFRFTANLSKRAEAAALRKSNQVFSLIHYFEFFYLFFELE